MFTEHFWNAIGKVIRGFSVSILALFLLTTQGWSQGFQGTIRGTVQDPDGLVILGATVTITNLATGEERTQMSTSTGTFNFPNLLVGNYRLTVELQGFRKYTRDNIQVSANQFSDIVARMEVGAITEEVSVVAGGEQVEVSSVQLEGFTTRNIVELPNPMLTGRADNFAILAPGTTSMPGGMAGEGGSIGGARPRMNNFVVDGVDNNDPSVTGALTPVIAEAVEEFTLLTNQFRAEYGHSAGGQFVTTTKSGTNAIHGRAWWYNQNRHTNALDNLTRAITAPGDPKPRYDFNRFGGQAGGPIMRDKWFYFGSYEYQNLNQAGTPSGEILVPTTAGLSTLQSLANSSGTGISPVAVGILANNVPVAGAQTASTQVLNEATGQMVTIPLGQFSATTPQFDRTHLFLINSDFEASRHRLSGRFSYSHNPFIEPGELPIAQFNSNAAADTRRITFSDVWTISPRVVNEFRAGYNRSLVSWPVDLPAAPGTTDIFGNYAINDISLFIGPQSNFPQSGVDNLYNFTNNVSVSAGAHTLKFGAEFRNIISRSDFLPRARGEFGYADMDEFVRDRFPSVVAIRGVGKADFAQNRPAYYAFAQDTWKISPRLSLDYGLRYELTGIARDQKLQDLNGIANVLAVTEEVFTEAIAPSPELVGQKIFPTLPARHQQALLAHVGNQLIFRRPDPDINNFAPRIGFAWDVFGDGTTSIRAGAGISHDVLYGNLALLQLPPQLQAENRETNACLLSPRPNWCSLVGADNDPLTAPIRHSTIGFLAGGGLEQSLPPDTLIDRYTARAAAGAWVPDEKLPEVYNWTLSIQRQMWQDWKFEARYIGNHGVFLPIQRWVSAGVPNPFRLPVFVNESDARATNFSGRPTLAQFLGARDLLLAPYGFGGVLTTFAPIGQSWYHGGSIGVEKRMSRGFTLNSSYTWSKTLDFIENDLFTSFLNPRRPFSHINLEGQKGLSGMHREHKFVASWVYELPRYNGSNRFLSGLASGWQYSGVYLLESGQPVTVISRADLNGDFDTAGDTAFFNPSGQENVGSGTNFVCFSGGATSVATSAAGCGGNANVVGYVAQNPNAQFIAPGAGGISNLGRGAAIMDGINTWNMTLSKKFNFGETRNFEVRIETWNTFNHPNFILGTGNVTGTTTAATTLPGYVTPSSSQFLDDTIFSGGGSNAPFQRIIQWGAKINF